MTDQQLEELARIIFPVDRAAVEKAKNIDELREYGRTLALRSGFVDGLLELQKTHDVTIIKKSI